MRIYKLVGIVLTALLLLASCADSDPDKKKVKIAYANWLEGIAMPFIGLTIFFSPCHCFGILFVVVNTFFHAAHP